jgi:hypothetical protein
MAYQQWRVAPASGKWQRRIILTLSEAQCSLSIRQLRIRCGMCSHQDKYGTMMRNILGRLVDKHVLVIVRRGYYAMRSL